jgi:hypothetical protein
MRFEPYVEQVKRWPRAGKHMLAQFDDETIIVYQAFRREIAEYAVQHGRFGGPQYGFSRMSWVKPNFLWMMFRSGWGTKQNQEATLALRIRRTFFDHLVGSAVASSFSSGFHASEEEWQAAVARSDVRLQWDPDHDPHGGKLERRAIQLGMRGATLREFAERQLLEVNDVSAFVAEQREHVRARRLDRLETPSEHVYPGSAETVR